MLYGIILTSSKYRKIEHRKRALSNIVSTGVSLPHVLSILVLVATGIVQLPIIHATPKMYAEFVYLASVTTMITTTTKIPAELHSKMQ